MKEVTTNMGNAEVKFLNFGLCFLPILAELYFPAHASLIFGQPFFMFSERVQRFNKTTVIGRLIFGDPCRKARNADIDANRWTMGNGRVDGAFGLDGNEPFFANTGNGDVLRRAEDVAAVAVAQPAEFRQEDAAVAGVDLEALRVAETVAHTFLLEAREVSAFLEEVLVGAFQMLQ